MLLARRAVKLFPRHAYSDRATVNRLRRRRIDARIALGDKWVCAKPVERRA